MKKKLKKKKKLHPWSSHTGDPLRRLLVQAVQVLDLSTQEELFPLQLGSHHPSHSLH